jgi:hypothetical protein
MVIDIAIHTNDGFLGADYKLQNSYPPIVDRCDLGTGLWIGRPQGEMVKAVMDFCDSTCIGTVSPFRQYSALYAFVRDQQSDCTLSHWDEDHRLTNCVALSRLIHPTSMGYRYAARVSVPLGEKPIRICKASFYGIDREAYISPLHTRNWLTASEAADLRDLMGSFRLASLPQRVSNALWYHEFAYRTWYADVRWTLVATALESLLNTDPTANKLQFCIRTVSLASDLDLQFTNDDARTAYQVRSKLAHGEAFLYNLPQAELRIYEQMELLLRAAILRSIRDACFARIFKDADTVRAKWPVC